jgi:ribosomal protein S18 acetylase RimI-like enzyme
VTTTLRPVAPERRRADGTRARTYAVCVNSRTVGGAELSTDPRYGPRVGRIDALAIDAGDRRRGRGTVAALAAEEVLRYWGCTRVEIAVPDGAAHALRIAEALGYTERNRNMNKVLDGPRHPLPAGSVIRPLTAAEYEPWREHERTSSIAELVTRGVPRDQAEAHEAAAFAAALPDGPATEGTALFSLDHDGETAGHLRLRFADPAWVFSVEVEPAHRGKGHGRTLMLAAENTCRDAGASSVQLNVFTGNVPALRLYESLGYRTTERHFAKPLS